MKKFYDVMWDGPMSGGSTDHSKSKELLVEIMMKKYGITNSDLNDIGVVRSKLRDINIDEILNNKK